jgi:cytochrome P450
MNTAASIPRYQGSGFAIGRLDAQRDMLGLGDIVRFRQGIFTNLLMVSSREYAEQVLVERAGDYVKSRGISLFARPMLGNGLLSSEGEHHKRQRSLMAPAFHPKAIANYATAVAEETGALERKLRDNEELDFLATAMELTLSVATKTMFHADVREDAPKIAEAFLSASRAMIGSLGGYFPIPPPFPLPKNLRMMRAVRTLDAIIYRIIRERRAAAFEDKGDVLSILLGVKDEATGEGMSETEIRDEVMTLFLAGHETTSNALSWTFWLLSQHPDIVAKLREETDRVLSERVPSFQDLPALPYTAAVLKESMRLFPPAYLTGRRALFNTRIGPHAVEKGTTVFVNIFGIHHRADYFPEPEAFRPERFLGAPEKTWPKCTYLPFGAGPRICIGNHFATMEGQIVLAHLASHFDFEPMFEGAPEPEPLVTLRPKGKLMMRVRRRQGATVSASASAA